MTSKRRRVGFVADVHLHNHSKFGGALSSGLNRRCRSILQALDRLVETAQRKCLVAIVVAGDLFDVSNPTPQIIAALLTTMDRFDGWWIIVEGNHDMRSPEIGDHALGPLRFGRRVVVVERAGPVTIPGDDVPIIQAVPFRPGPAVEWFPTELVPGIPVAIHLGVIDDSTPEFLRRSDDAIAVERLDELAERCGVPLVVAGNWHTHRRWSFGGREVVQVGVFCPKTIAEDGPDYGKCVIYDSGKRVVESIETIDGPRFVRASDLDLLEAKVAELELTGRHDVFVEYEHSAPSEDLAQLYKAFADLQERQRIVDWKVVGVDVSRTEIESDVARAIAASSSFEEAVDEFVGSRVDPNGGWTAEMAARVAVLVRGYLAGRSGEEVNDGDS